LASFGLTRTVSPSRISPASRPLGRLVTDRRLDQAAQRPGAVHRVVSPYRIRAAVYGLRDERPPQPATPGLHDPAAGDAGWIGEAGPGPSYLDPGSGGPENDFTNRNTTFMTWNLLHLARMVKHAGGIPAHGNQRSEWDTGCYLDFENPECR
jgi:multimeric flavodoxin WrbA